MKRRLCMREGCERAATCIPLLKVPAQGWPMQFHTPATMFIGIESCDEHFAELNVAELLTDDIRDACTKAVRALNRAPPDFKRAILEPLSVDDPQYAEFLRRGGGRSQ